MFAAVLVGCRARAIATPLRRHQAMAAVSGQGRNINPDLRARLRPACLITSRLGTPHTPTSRLRPFHADLTAPVFTTGDERTLFLQPFPGGFPHPLLISSRPGNEGPPEAAKTHPSAARAGSPFSWASRAAEHLFLSAATATKERRPRRGRRARFHDRHKAKRLPGMERARRG